MHPYRLKVHMKNQKGPKHKTIVEELGKRTRGPLNPHRLYVHMENRNGSKDEMSLKELEGRALSAPEPNVMYSVHCTVHYYAGAIDEDTDEKKHKDRGTMSSSHEWYTKLLEVDFFSNLIFCWI